MVVAVTGVAAADYIRAHSEVVGDAVGAGRAGRGGRKGRGGAGGRGCAGSADDVRSGGRVKLRP
jgi:hypothetical protein